MSPFRKEVRWDSLSEVEVEGSPKKSPTMMARVKAFLAWSVLSFEKTVGIWPLVSPIMILWVYVSFRRRDGRGSQ